MIPGEAFRRAVNAAAGGRDLLALADEVALTFGVTPRAVAIRARRLELVSRAQLTELLRRLDARATSGAAAGGGNYYWNRIAQLGPSFVRLVLTALDSQALTYPRASGLLGVKLNNFGTLRDYMTRRTASP
jgi:Zn-dependent peptidase ImmA (M78 family)